MPLSSCRDALTSQFMVAVGDIRLLTSLHKGCTADTAKLCPNVQPGSGRVIGCLQQHSSAVQSSSCRRQLMRLQGFAAHDYRLDYHLRKVRRCCRQRADSVKGSALTKVTHMLYQRAQALQFSTWVHPPMATASLPEVSFLIW
eukprot:GHRQ01040073.1.p2 GENE.GHRQ01040073.1~~GHRQ01040073.1.p2  ORF type:complete len:143 (-),score=39.27 GHRQ01040073.1:150-578(-)